MRMDVPGMTIIRARGSTFHAVPGRHLSLEEAAAKAGYEPAEVEIVWQNGSLIFTDSLEENMLSLTELVFTRAVDWARERISKELGG